MDPASPVSNLTSAFKTLYSFLSHLPHIPPSVLSFPTPNGGWPNIPVQTLVEDKCKTREVIELLRHLPYLSRRDDDGGGWMLGPDTVSMDFSAGELWPEWIEEVQEVPAWCVWVARREGRGGGWILADARSGTLTQYTPLEDHLTIPYAQYETLAPQDRWMAHPTMDAMAFVQLWIKRFEKLVWMPVPITVGNRGEKAKVAWYFTAETREEEEDLLAEDEEFEDDGEEDEEAEDYTEEGGQEEEGAEVAEDELDGLWKDAYGEVEGRQRRDELERQEREMSEEKPADSFRGTPSGGDRNLLGRSTWDAKTKEVYDIYTLSGWPSSFDRAKCETMLQELVGRGH
ncbi:MAG: hypothetical protein Q9201_001151 [Fulgogasparrea decipioides]